MSEIERINTGDMKAWKQAAEAAQHNEISGAVMRVGADEATMRNALVREEGAPPTMRDRPEDRLLRPNLVSADLSRASIIAHNASVDPKDRVPEDSILPDLRLVYQRNGTQFHTDGYGNDPAQPEARRMPLNQVIQILGKVGVSFLRISKFEDDDEFGDAAYRLTERREGLSSGDRVLKPEYDSPDRKFVAAPGDLTIFSGFGDIGERRYPVGHQFIALGNTPEEREARTSGIINPLDVMNATPSTTPQTTVPRAAA